MTTANISKITFVTRKWPPSIGGMETYCLKLVQSLRDCCEVDLIALQGNQDGTTPGILRLFRFGLVASIRVLTCRHPGEILHIGDMASWPLAVAGKIRSRHWSIVLSAHGTDVSFSRRPGVRGWLYGRYMALGAVLLGRAQVIANSKATAAMVKAHGFESVVVVKLATDMLPYEPPPKRADYLLFVGRLIEGKGCAWFIRNVLPKLSESIRLKVAGVVWDERERALLDSPRVDYLGSITGDPLSKLYAESLCVIVPNIEPKNGSFEGFGIVAIEAAAAGAVVLASDHAGLKDAVINGVTGFHIAAEEPGEWVAKIAEVAGWTQDERDAFVKRSILTTKREYSWNRVAQETLAAYESILSPLATAG